MTSNVGARDLERRPLGLGPQHVDGSSAKREVERVFSPEFRNRLDAIVYFNPLDPVTIGQVVGKQLMELENQLLTKKVEVEVSAEVREWLAQKGYDRLMGARPMARLIQDQIKKPLANEILFGKLENGGKVKVVMKDGAPAFEFAGSRSKKGGSSSKASAQAASGSDREE
jgi:ATP-dependent Clp protease ATP-binding subunit ClpA